MRQNYKAFPVPADHPFPQDKFIWSPVLSVAISYPAKHSPPTRRFEAYIDSGSPNCYFHADIGETIGIPIKAGFRSLLGGIVRGRVQEVFFHEISIHVAGSIIRVKAGFTDQLSVAGILGRMGFFDNYLITFDHTSEIPAFEIQKINRA